MTHRSYLKLNDLSIFVLFFLILNLVFFHKVFFNPSQTLVGGESDSTNGILIWASRFSKHHFSGDVKGFLISTGYPFGEGLFSFTELTQIIPRLFIASVTILIDPIFAYNFFIFLNLMLNTVVLYKLFFLFTSNKTVIFLSVSLISYSHYFFSKLENHILYISFWIPAGILYLGIKFLKYRNNVIFYKIIGFYVLTAFYDGYYPFILFPIFLISYIFYVVSNVKKYHYFLILNIIILTIFVTVAIIMYQNSGINNLLAPQRRSLQDLNGFSFSILDFFRGRPEQLATQLIENLAGIFFINMSSLGGSEKIHLSVIQILIIFLVPIYELIRKISILKKLNYIQMHYSSLSNKLYLQRVNIYLISIFIVTLLIASPEKISIGTYAFSNPYIYFFDFFPFWRSTARAGIVLEIILTIYFAYLLNKFFMINRKKIYNNLYLLLLIFLVLLQINFFPINIVYSKIDFVKKDNIYYIGKEVLPKDSIVAISEWGKSDGRALWTAYLGRKTNNYYFDYGSYSNLFDNSRAILDPQTPCNLKFLGTDYLFILNAPSDVPKKINSSLFMLVRKSPSFINNKNIDYIFKLNKKGLKCNTQSYISFDRKTTEIMTYYYSLITLYSGNSLMVRNISNKASNKVTGLCVKFGISSEIETKISIKSSLEEIIVFSEPGKMTDTKLAVNSDDEFLFTIDEKAKLNKISLSSPRVEPCTG